MTDEQRLKLARIFVKPTYNYDFELLLPRKGTFSVPIVVDGGTGRWHGKDAPDLIEIYDEHLITQAKKMRDDLAAMLEEIGV